MQPGFALGNKRLKARKVRYKDMNVSDYITGFQHLGIPTPDMDATIDFYQKLGFEIIYATLNEGNRVTFLKRNTMVIEAYESDSCAMAYGSIDHVALDVTDVEAAYKAICEMGMNNLNDEIHFLPFWEKGFRYFKIEGPSKESVEFGQIL